MSLSQGKKFFKKIANDLIRHVCVCVCVCVPVCVCVCVRGCVCVCV